MSPIINSSFSLSIPKFINRELFQRNTRKRSAVAKDVHGHFHCFCTLMKFVDKKSITCVYFLERIDENKQRHKSFTRFKKSRP